MSKYCYPGTNILINKADIRDLVKLEIFEAAFSLKRIAELYNRPITGTFNSKHLKEIHYYIFQDIYPFAGEFRREDIIKGTSIFARYQFIEPQLEKLFKELHDENYLRGLERIIFSEKLAYYFAELNAIHPFREGNGRTIREFIRCLSLQAGYQIDWSCIDQDSYIQASIQSMSSSPEKLAKLIYSAIGV